MVGPASSVPRPPGAPSAGYAEIVCITRTPSARERPLPNHSTGQVGTAQPEWPRRSHHSSTVRSGSQLASSQVVTSAVRSSTATVVMMPSPWYDGSAEKFGDDAQLVGGVAQEHEVVGALDLVEMIAHVLDGQRVVLLEIPRALTHEHAGDATAADRIDVPGDRAVLVHQPGDDRRHETGRELVGELVTEDLAGHAGTRGGCDRVHLDVAALAFLGEHVGQADEAHLRRPVVRLTEIAEEPGGRCGDDHPAVGLLAHVHPCRLRHVEGAPQVDVEHG